MPVLYYLGCAAIQAGAVFAQLGWMQEAEVAFRFALDAFVVALAIGPLVGWWFPLKD